MNPHYSYVLRIRIHVKQNLTKNKILQKHFPLKKTKRKNTNIYYTGTPEDVRMKIYIYIYYLGERAVAKSQKSLISYRARGVS